jgi:hypothetical protein
MGTTVRALALKQTLVSFRVRVLVLLPVVAAASLRRGVATTTAGPCSQSLNQTRFYRRW